MKVVMSLTCWGVRSSALALASAEPLRLTFSGFDQPRPPFLNLHREKSHSCKSTVHSRPQCRWDCRCAEQDALRLHIRVQLQLSRKQQRRRLELHRVCSIYRGRSSSNALLVINSPKPSPLLQPLEVQGMQHRLAVVFLQRASPADGRLAARPGSAMPRLSKSCITSPAEGAVLAAGKPPHQHAIQFVPCCDPT